MELDSPFSNKSSELKTMYGSFNSYKVSFKHFSGIRNNFGYNFRISTTGSDGFRYNSSGKSTSISGSIGYKDDFTTIKFNTIFGITTNGQSWIATPEGMDPKYNMLSDTNRFGIKPQYDNFKQGIYQLEIASKLSDYSSINFSTYLSTINGNYDIPEFYDNTATNDIFEGYGMSNNLKLNSSNLGGYLNLKSNNKYLTSNTGINFNNFKREHIGLPSINNIYSTKYINNGYKYDISAYNKTTIKFNKINIEGDIQIRNARFKYINDALDLNIYNYAFLNYSLGLFFKNGIIKPYINFSQSGRESTRTNLFGSNDNPTDISQIENVKPEYVQDLELGVKFTGRIKGSFNFYYMNFKDEIVAIGQVNSMGITLGKNVNKSKRLGIELELNTKLYKNLSINSNFNLSKNNIYDDNRKFEPVQTPNFLSNIGLIYDNGKFNTGLDYKFVKKSFIDLDNNFILPEYHMLNANLGYSFNKLSVGVLINNILNKNWTTGGTSDGVNKSFYYTSGINTYLTLNYKL